MLNMGETMNAREKKLLFAFLLTVMIISFFSLIALSIDDIIRLTLIMRGHG